jgi:pimeloyl-ACP methyl ester carboxylesterase
VSVRRFQAGELQLAYRLVNKKGAGTVPLVFVHGLTQFSYDWMPVASALGREAACLDQRGFGDSDWCGDYSVPAMAGDVGALLDHLGWKKAIVVGHGLGARNALYFASRRPRRVAGLALIDYAPEYAAEGERRVAEGVAGVPDVFASVEAAMAHFRAPREARVRFAAYLLKIEGGFAVKRDAWFRERSQKFLAGTAPKPRVDLWKALARLRVPTLVVRGTKSDLFAVETVEKVKRVNAAIEVVEVNARHNVAADNITALVAALRRFVESLEGKAKAPGAPAPSPAPGSRR